jgi:hypothetical protein
MSGLGAFTASCELLHPSQSVHQFCSHAAFENDEVSFGITLFPYPKVADKFLEILLLVLQGIYRYRYRLRDAIPILAVSCWEKN